MNGRDHKAGRVRQGLVGAAFVAGLIFAYANTAAAALDDSERQTLNKISTPKNEPARIPALY